MLLRNVQKYLQLNSASRVRFQNTKSQQSHGDPTDFRPPWVYIGSRLVTFTIIPGIMLYSVFFYDFGEREHVFQPVRRWALERKAAFLALSPDEERYLNVNNTKPKKP